MNGFDLPEDLMAGLSGADSPADLQMRLRKVLPLYEFIDLSIDSWGAQIECSVPLSASNGNHLNTMHAAILWAVAEVPGGIIYFSNIAALGACFAVVEHFEIDFIKPARSRIRARADFGGDRVSVLKDELDRTGRTRFALSVTLIDEGGETVARATGRYYFRTAG